MRLLLIHANYLEFEAKQPTPAAEEIAEQMKSGRVEEALVAFVAVEEADEPSPDAVATNAAKEIADVCSQVETKRVVLYPYAHLSSSLASPSVAVKIMDLVRDKLQAQNFEVFRLPFGWYKAFTLSCKGHPLSELSRTVTAEAVEEEVAEEKLPGEYLILTSDGIEHKLDLNNIDACEALMGQPLLKQFVLSEELGQKPGEEPAHVKLMKKLELVDYEPASDTGHFRFYPNGALIKNLLEELAIQVADELGASRIETPVVYNEDEPDIGEQAARFYQKDYKIRLPNKTLLLRFAGDFGLFRMMKNTMMSYKQMPVRIFELSPSYRLEQSGECIGLKRMRAFTMPDIHCFCRDLEQGLEEYERLFMKYTKLVDAIKIDHVVAFRVVKEFYLQHKHFIARLLKQIKAPALIELLPEQKHYWVMKHEFQMIDSVGGNGQLSTVQLDLEDSERYGIFYVDEDGKKRGCIILHSSMGSIERWMYAVLEEAAKQQKAGKAPSLPLWLSPTQVRLIPVSSEHLKFCLKVAEDIEKKNVRVDVDDRNETVAKKVRDAERDWVPYIVVIGEKEMKIKNLPARVRGVEKLKVLTSQKLVDEIKKETVNMPFKLLALPKLLSMRPIFVGS
jgi:threonyl-tRNA synthetase